MISLFVRSYPNDFQWLHYSVKSMRMNLIGIDDKVLCVPKECIVPKDIAIFFDKVVYTEEQQEGYVAQQVDKIRAYKYCKHERILFSDSDCMYYHLFDANNMIESDQIVLYKTKYSSMDGAILQWQGITELATGIKPEWEYMRCFPIMHHASVCHWLDTSPIYNTYLQTMSYRALSEFNALGIIAEEFFPHHYVFKDTEVELPTQHAKQYWSWGGITEEIATELGTLHEPKH